MQGNILFSFAVIGLLSISSQWLAWWARLPAILFLLLSGLLIGPVTGYLSPDRLFGDLLMPIVSLSVSVILFEGSLTLKLEEIKELKTVVRNLITIGSLITWFITAAAVHYFFHFEYRLAFLFGAVVIVTGPTVIMPMIRSVRPNSKITNVLKWEGIAIDPLGALLAVIVFDFIISSHGENALGNMLATFGKIILTGITIGSLSALALGLVLRRRFVPEYLRNVLTLTLVFAVYALSDLIQHESGLLAVTIMGITLTNLENTDIEDILDFKESLSVLLISGLFIILAARIEPVQMIAAGWAALGVLMTVLFIARPLAVLISTLGSDLTLKERLLIAWIGPRGIVAAAVAAIFALRLEEAGFKEASVFVPLVFFIVIGTVVIQSLTAKQVAHWLGVREPPPKGLLIIGAGNVARTIGKVLQEEDFKVILTDSNWENTRIARMEGLETYYGNPISEHADRHLDLVGIGKMLGLSGRGNLDALAFLRFKSEFGSENIYELLTTREKLIPDKHRISTRHRGNQLFAADISYGTLANLLRDGAEVHRTSLSEEYDFQKFLAANPGRCIPLFAIDERKILHIFTVEKNPEPKANWKIISLILPETLPPRPPASPA